MKSPQSLIRTLACAACFFPLVVSAQETAAPKVDASGGPATLKMEWQAGKTYTQKVTLDQSSKISMLGQEMEQKMKMNMDLSMEVSLLVGTPLKEVKAQYERVAMEMDAMGQKMGFDSSAGAAQPGNPFAALSGLVGKPFTLTVDEKNELVDVKGMDELLEGAASNPAAAEIVRQIAGKDQIAQMMNLGIAQTLPKAPVKVGETWDVKMPLNLGPLGKVEVTGKYTYLGTAPKNGVNCAVIAMDTTLTVNLDSSQLGGEAGGNPLAMKITDGAQKGHLYWDTQANWLRGLELDQAMTLSIQPPGGEAAMTVPTTQKTTIDVDIK